MSKVLPFRDLRISLFQRPNIFPEIFAKPIVAFLNFCFSSDVVFESFPISACVLTQPCTLPVTHAAKHTQLIHPFSRTCDTRSRTPGPAPRGGGVGEDGALLGASRWRRWTWLLSTESRHSYTMGPFTHMSDSVADWGRGTLRVAPSLVGGPQNCVGFWFISVHNQLFSFLHFVVIFQDLLISYFWMSLVLPGQTSSFVVIWSSFPKTTAPITQKLCQHVSQHIRCRCFAFSTCSHSFSLAPTRHLKLHLGWFLWNAKWNPHIFLSDKMQLWIPRAKHNGSNFSHSLSLALSLLICLCWTECCIVNKTPEYPRWRLELESLGWHVGWVKAESSALDGLWDQAGVFINLKDRRSNRASNSGCVKRIMSQPLNTEYDCRAPTPSRTFKVSVTKTALNRKVKKWM